MVGGKFHQTKLSFIKTTFINSTTKCITIPLLRGGENSKNF